MPAVLVELAFISNGNEYKYLASQDGQESSAERMFQAFKSYKTQYDKSLNITPTEPVQVVTAQSKPQEYPYFSIQVMSGTKLIDVADPVFKGLHVDRYAPSGTNIYKYIVGKYSTRQEAQAELSNVKKKFPEAFIIEVKSE